MLNPFDSEEEIPLRCLAIPLFYHSLSLSAAPLPPLPRWFPEAERVSAFHPSFSSSSRRKPLWFRLHCSSILFLSSSLNLLRSILAHLISNLFVVSSILISMSRLFFIIYFFSFIINWNALISIWSSRCWLFGIARSS